MLLDIGKERVSDAPLNPLNTAPGTFMERMAAEWDNQRLTYGTGSGARSLHAAYEQQREKLRQLGFDAPNPVDADATALGGIFRSTAGRDVVAQEYSAIVAKARQQNPELQSYLLMPDEVQAQADDLARGARTRAEELDKVGGNGAASLLSQVGAAVIDPVNVLTMPIGAGAIAGGAARRILLGALAEGAVGAGAQLAVDLNPFGAGGARERARLGLDTEIGAGVLGGFLGGAVLGGGARAVAEGVRAMRTTRPALDPGAALAEADAATILDRASRDLSSSPGGARTAEQHIELTTRAVEAVAAGRVAPDEVRLPVAPPPPRPAPPAFIPGANDSRVRIGQHERGSHFLNPEQDVGAFTYEVRRGENDTNPLAMVLDRDGKLIERDKALTEDNGSSGRAWIPPNKAAADTVRGLLERRAQTAIGSAERKAVDAEIAAAVKNGRATTAARSVTPGVTAAPPRAPITAGTEQIRIHTPAGRSIAAEPQVVELRDLVPSHTDDMALNPAYPHGEGVQPRDRTRDASIAQIRDIAGNLEPERLRTSPEAGNGAPIVDGENVVESGNGRVLALRQVYGDPALAEKAAAYRAMLEAQGLDVAGFQQPVLVSRRVTALDPEARRSFVREANSTTALTMGAAERARLDADLAGRALDLYQGGDVTAAANTPFVRAFMQGVPAAERGSLIAGDGTLSGEGARRLRGAVLARAYGDEMGPLLDRILEGEAEGLRNIAGALQDVAPRWAAMRLASERGEIAPGLDTTADLLAAVRTVSLSREKRIPVADLLAQTDLDAPPLTDQSRALLASMYRDPGYRNAAGRESLANRLAGYLDEAMQTRPEPDLFGAPPPSAGDVMAATDPARGQQRALVQAAERMAEVQAQPRVQDAEFLEAQRIAAAQDIAIPVDENGGTRGLRELLDEAEDGLADAAQASACLIGGAGSLL